MPLWRHRCLTKHALAKKHAAQRNSVQTANQLVIFPGFYGMSISQVMQINIGILHIFGDPGAGAVRTRCGTVIDDFLKGLVEGKNKALFF